MDRLPVMIVDIDDAKTRLFELVRAVEERNETVVLCRDGRQVAEIRRVRDLTPDPRLFVEMAPGYDPTEPLSDDEWPDDLK